MVTVRYERTGPAALLTIDRPERRHAVDGDTAAALLDGEAEEALQRLGGSIASGVSKGLNHLIVGEEAGSKRAKAQQRGVPIRDEAWLIALLAQHQETERWK